MNRLRERKSLTLKNSNFAIAAALFLLVGLAVLLWFAWPSSGESATLRYVSTVAGLKGEFGEPFPANNTLSQKAVELAFTKPLKPVKLMKLP